MTAVAQVCLYGTPGSGYAFLASRPGLARDIAAKGGWNGRETQPSGGLRSLTDAVETAKVELRALGLERGDLLVFMPGGELCARTPLETFQTVGSMRFEQAPVALISAKTIERAAREIARNKRYTEEWRPECVTWHRPAKRGAERALVAVFRGNLVWVSSGAGHDGRWGIVQALSRERRQIQVDADWIDLARVRMRQEAVAAGIPAPVDASAPQHSAFALLIDALRSRVSLGKTLLLASADGERRRLKVVDVSSELGAGGFGFLAVSGTDSRGSPAQLVIPDPYDDRGAPVHRAELRWSGLRRVEVDARTIRFAGSKSRHESSRAPSSAVVSAKAEPDRWSKGGVVWYRPIDRGTRHRRVDLRHGDLVWASFGSSDVKKRGAWGRIESFSRAKQRVKVGTQWFDLPLIFPRDEAIAAGVEPPAAPASLPPRPETPFMRLLHTLRHEHSRDRMRGARVRFLTADAKRHELEIERSEHDPNAIVLFGKIRDADAQLSVPIATTERGEPRYRPQLRRGAKKSFVHPSSLVFERAPRAGMEAT